MLNRYKLYCLYYITIQVQRITEVQRITGINELIPPEGQTRRSAPTKPRDVGAALACSPRLNAIEYYEARCHFGQTDSW